MILAIGRFAAVAVSTKVGNHEAVILGELWRNQPPRDVRERRAMKKKYSGTAAACDDINRRSGGLDLDSLKASWEETKRIRWLLRLAQCARSRRRSGDQRRSRLLNESSPVHECSSSSNDHQHIDEF